MKPLEVVIATCAHCRRFAVFVDGLRITRHKCAGQWTHVFREEVEEGMFDRSRLRLYARPRKVTP